MEGRQWTVGCGFIYELGDDDGCEGDALTGWDDARRYTSRTTLVNIFLEICIRFMFRLLKMIQNVLKSKVDLSGYHTGT